MISEKERERESTVNTEEKKEEVFHVVFFAVVSSYLFCLSVCYHSINAIFSFAVKVMMKKGESSGERGR